MAAMEMKQPSTSALPVKRAMGAIVSSPRSVLRAGGGESGKSKCSGKTVKVRSPSVQSGRSWGSKTPEKSDVDEASSSSSSDSSSSDESEKKKSDSDLDIGTEEELPPPPKLDEPPMKQIRKAKQGKRIKCFFISPSYPITTREGETPPKTITCWCRYKAHRTLGHTSDCNRGTKIEGKTEEEIQHAFQYIYWWMNRHVHVAGRWGVGCHKLPGPDVICF